MTALDAKIQEQLASLKAAGFDMGAMAKAITQSTGLVNYNLEAPAKKLVPVLSPIRNELARVVTPNGGTGVNWKAVTAYAPGTYQTPVQEGKRNETWDPTVLNYLAAFKGFGSEQSLTYEGEFAAKGFEDVRDDAVTFNLRQLMISDEKMILGGNTSIALGTAATPTVTAFASGGTIAATTAVVVSCVYLTHEGWSAATVAGGVPTVRTRTNMGGTTTTINGGSGQIGSSASVTTGGGSTNSVVASVAIPSTKLPIAGYAWFWGPTSGAAQTLGAITTTNSVTITVAAGTGTQAANAAGLAADHSQDALAFDGILSIAFGGGLVNPSGGTGTSGSYLQALSATLTSDGGGGIVEVDAMLKDRWDNYRIGMTTLYIGSQLAVDMSRLVTANSGSPLVRMTTELKDGATVPFITGGAPTLKWYYNKFTGDNMRVIIHPYMPTGMMIAMADNLPDWYPANGVNTVHRLLLRRDYYMLEFPQVNRQYEYGLYWDGVYQHYFPAGIGVIYNIPAAS